MLFLYRGCMKAIGCIGLRVYKAHCSMVQRLASEEVTLEWNTTQHNRVHLPKKRVHK